MTTPRARHLRIPASIARRVSIAAGFVSFFAATLAPQITETAIANGDTRTIYLHHAHTGEDIAATYLVGGQYDSRVLQQLNWFLRDWRRNEPTNMDPRLFDVVWEAYRQAGAGNQVINVVSAYRSPETNAMLRARSRAVAKYSQHMLGKAMDTTMPGMPMSHIREIGMRMQRGGVGYYPTAGTPFVHLDVGNVRSWPRMSYDQLVRLFPDGKTVHLPTNGQPLARYEEAKAEIEARGNGAYVVAPRRTVGGFFAMLFGGGEEEPEEVAAPPAATRKQWGLPQRQGRGVQTALGDDSEEGGAAPAPAPQRGRKGRQIAKAEENLPRGETAMSAAPTESAEAQQQQYAQYYAQQAAQQQYAQQQAAQQQAAQSQYAQQQQVAEAAPEAEEPKRKFVRAPLPPHRPALLVARVEAAPEPEPDNGKPQPLVDASPERVASVDARDLRSTVDEPAPASELAAPTRNFVKAPLPPRRPGAIVASGSVATGAPLPPARRDAAHAIASIVKEETKPTDEALAFAPTGKTNVKKTDGAASTTPAAPLPPRRTALAPVRIEPAPAAPAPARASGNSVIGSSLTGLRAAARATRPTTTQ